MMETKDEEPSEGSGQRVSIKYHQGRTVSGTTYEKQDIRFSENRIEEDYLTRYLTTNERSLVPGSEIIEDVRESMLEDRESAAFHLPVDSYDEDMKSMLYSKHSQGQSSNPKFKLGLESSKDSKQDNSRQDVDLMASFLQGNNSGLNALRQEFNERVKMVQSKPINLQAKAKGSSYPTKTSDLKNQETINRSSIGDVDFNQPKLSDGAQSRHSINDPVDVSPEELEDDL